MKTTVPGCDGIDVVGDALAGMSGAKPPEGRVSVLVTGVFLFNIIVGESAASPGEDEGNERLCRYRRVRAAQTVR
jgi:hypothetical protein